MEAPGLYQNNTVNPPASIRDPACIWDLASISTTQFTNEHVFKALRFSVLYLLLQSKISLPVSVH